MPTIAFRVDASSIVGSGHAIRCAALAGQLRAHGADVCFICREQPGDWCDWLANQGYAVHRLPVQEGGVSPGVDAAQTCAALSNSKPVEWLVTDHYGIDHRWELAAREVARRILVIDDLADRSHDCDFVLNQNFSNAPDNLYAALVPPGTKILLGPRYALLRPEFAMLRSTSRHRGGDVRRILICFGGADPQNHTGAALQALRGYIRDIDRVDVVVGPGNPHKQSIAALCADTPNAVLHCPASEIAELLSKADLAIGGGGTMNWERSCLGVPTVAFGIAANQRKVLEALIEAGYVLGVAEMQTPHVERIAAWIGSALGNAPLLRGLSRRVASLTDGLGAERVVDLMLPTKLDFRQATIDDTDLIFRCRNDPTVRGVSIDSREISRETHDAWMSRTLSSPERILLVAGSGGEPRGVVRFDLRPPEAVISVYRVPSGSIARLGLIRQATLWFRSRFPNIKRVVAEILPENTASLVAFRAAGYHDGMYVLETDLDDL